MQCCDSIATMYESIPGECTLLNALRDENKRLTSSVVLSIRCYKLIIVLVEYTHDIGLSFNMSQSVSNVIIIITIAYT